MDYEAVALLRIPDYDREDLDLQLLDDGVLLFTGEPFETATDDLLSMITSQLGDALAQHQDPRGIFIFPDACDPRARKYEGVVGEVGELGFWLVPDESDSLEGEAGDLHEADLLLLPDTFQGLVEGFVQQLGEQLGVPLPPPSDSKPEAGRRRA